MMLGSDVSALSTDATTAAAQGLSIVVPIHNEEPSILRLYDRLTAVLERLQKPFEIIFVDDASTDRSFDLLANLVETDSRLKVIRLRRNWYDNTRGLKGHQINVHHVNDSDKLVAFHRWDRGGSHDDVVVVLNFANRSYPAYRIGLPRAGLWRVRFNGDWRGYNTAFTDQPSYDLWAMLGGNNDAMPFGGEVSIGPYTALILSQDE